MSLTNQRKQVYNKRDMRYLPCLVRRRLHKKNTWYTLLWRSCIVPVRTDLCTPRRSRGWSRMQSCQEGEEENCLRGNSCTVSPPPSWWSCRTCEMILAWLQLSSESPAGPECTGHRWCPGQLSCCGSHCRSSPWAECWRSEPGRVSPWRPWSDWQSSLRGWSLSPPRIGLLGAAHHILAFSRPHTDVCEIFWITPHTLCHIAQNKIENMYERTKECIFLLWYGKQIFRYQYPCTAPYDNRDNDDMISPGSVSCEPVSASPWRDLCREDRDRWPQDWDTGANILDLALQGESHSCSSFVTYQKIFSFLTKVILEMF